MPADPNNLIHQLAVGDADAVARIIDQARTSVDVTTLVSAAVFAPDPTDLLHQARGVATTTRDRQVVAIAAAHIAGNSDLVDALARDHLTDHPTSVLVAWITANTPPSNTPPTNTNRKDTQ